MALQLARSRRRALAVIASGLGVLAGCGSTTPTESPSTTRVSAPTSTTLSATSSETESPTPTSTDTTESCPATTPGTSLVYSFGEWHETNGDETDLGFTVTNLELMDTFRFDGSNETYVMPEDRRLVVVTVGVRNLMTSPDSIYYNERFALICANGTARQPTGVHHPALSDRGIHLPRLEGVEHARQYRPEGYQLEPGETGRLWWAFVVSGRACSRSLQVGFTPAYAECPNYLVRWIP